MTEDQVVGIQNLNPSEMSENKQRRYRRKSSFKRQNKSNKNTYDSSSSSDQGQAHITRLKTLANGPIRTGESQEHISNALQKFSYLLVDQLVYKESEIPDHLIDGCLSEDESNHIMAYADRKTQNRHLIRLIKGRSYEVIEKFLKIIKPHCTSVVEQIWTQYKIQVKDGKPSDIICPFCKLKQDVDIKNVLDYMWSEKIIPCTLYDEITDTRCRVGQQDQLWNNLLNICFEGNNFNKLCEALMLKDHYTHIATALKELSNNPEITQQCSCRPIMSYKGHIAKQAIPIVVDDELTTCSPNERSHYDDMFSHIDLTKEDEDVSRLPNNITSENIPVPRQETLASQSHSRNTFEPPRKRMNSTSVKSCFHRSSWSERFRRLIAFCRPIEITEESIEDNTQPL